MIAPLLILASAAAVGRWALTRELVPDLVFRGDLELPGGDELEETTGHAIVRHAGHATLAAIALTALGLFGNGFLGGGGGFVFPGRGTPQAPSQPPPGTPTLTIIPYDTAATLAGDPYQGAASLDSVWTELDTLGGDFSAPVYTRIRGAFTTDTLAGASLPLTTDSVYQARIAYHDVNGWSSFAVDTFTASASIAPDWVWDVGQFASKALMHLDSLYDTTAWGGNNPEALKIVDSMPAAWSGLYQGSYQGRVWRNATNSMSNISGIQIYVPSAAALQLRDIYLEFYIRWTAQPDTFSAGWSFATEVKTALMDGPNMSRFDLIYHNTELHAEPVGGQNFLWESFDTHPNKDTINALTLGLRDGNWHHYQYRVRLGNYGAADGYAEMWIDGRSWNAVGRATPQDMMSGAYISNVTWTDTFNHAYELINNTAYFSVPDTVTVMVSPIRAWWTQVPDWYPAYPDSEKFIP